MTVLARLPSSLNHNIHEPEFDTDTDVNMNMNQATRDRPEADCRPVNSPSGGAARDLTSHWALTGRSSSAPVDCGRYR